MKKTFTTVNTLIGVAITVCVGIAILEQLRLPREERTWQGSVFGIPYNFSKPTAERMRKAIWNEETSQVFVPRAFGLGWDVNLYPLLHPQTVEHGSERTR